jgi:hypothetical protein
MRWRFFAVVLAGALSGNIVQRDLATGFGMQSVAAIAMSAIIVVMLLRTRT